MSVTVMSDVLRISQMFSNILKCSQMFSDVFRMIPGLHKCSLDVCKMISRCFQVQVQCSHTFSICCQKVSGCLMIPFGYIGGSVGPGECVLWPWSVWFRWWTWGFWGLGGPGGLVGLLGLMATVGLVFGGLIRSIGLVGLLCLVGLLGLLVGLVGWLVWRA